MLISGTSGSHLFQKAGGTHAKHGSEGIPEEMNGHNQKDVSRVADLARLALTTEESGLYTIQLGRTLDHGGETSRNSTPKVFRRRTRPAPLGAGTLDAFFSKPLRDDATVAPLDRDEALANAPEKKRAASRFRR